MIKKPIKLKDISLQLPHKTCFLDFSAEIPYGSRISLIGRNGSGKSTLLKAIAGQTSICEGRIEVPPESNIGYVEQIPEGFEGLSGAQRFNAALSKALSSSPDVLLLDEPTNHLDSFNRKSLFRHLQSYRGTLIIASHDTELLRNCVDTLWHIDKGRIHIYCSNYDDYIRELNLKKASIERDFAKLNQDKREAHNKLMQEQQRASKSKAKGEKNIDQNKYPTIVSKAKAGRAQETSGRKKSAIDHRKQELNHKLNELDLPKIIKPNFIITAQSTKVHNIVQISSGSIGYMPGHKILSDINFTVSSRSRIAITGSNGSGKTTVLKAIMNAPEIVKDGQWYAPAPYDIGYLDQHYSTLDPELSVLESVIKLAPHWSQAEIRKHLNDFLFRKNEEVNALVSTLSGGEKARLNLALIGAKTPKLLILDEITNNLDLETKAHVIEVLREYPGAIIAVSHDEDFLYQIGIEDRIKINKDLCK